MNDSVSYLFVPGSREDRFEKAIAAGADRVIIDLEDAVDPADKATARASIVAALAGKLSAPVLVRLNGDDSEWFTDDVAALSAASRENPGALAGVIMPKLESTETVAEIREAFGSAPDFEVIGLIESAKGVSLFDTLAASGVTRLAIGGVDLSVDLGSDVYSPLLDHVYARVVIASRLAGIGAPIGSPPLDLRDEAGIEATARRLKSMGIAAQLCIHPAQVAPVHKAFDPTQEEIEWAQRVLDSVGGSAQVDGQMVDKPVRDRAERVLAQAERRAR